MSQRLLDLTRAMTDAAERDDWNGADSLRAERDALLQSLRAHPETLRDRALIAELYQFNERCLALALQRRQARVQGVLEERRQVEGVARYLEVGA